ncbi:MAG: hypothetical protein ACHQ9S_05720 [Candidatus Binatia bacterium]
MHKKIENCASMSQSDDQAFDLKPRPPLRKLGRASVPSISVRSLRHLTKATRSQLSHWEVRAELTPIRAERVGHRKPTRTFSLHDSLKVWVMCDARRAGFGPQEALVIGHDWDRHATGLDDLESYILTDGHSVYYARTDTDVVAIHRRHLGSLALIVLREHAEALKANP